MPKATMSSASRKHHGFSLIEVLVALLVLSIGLLGLAGLQTLGLKFNTQSYQRTQAVLNAYDIVDRMRANAGGITAAVYDDIDIATLPSPPPEDCAAVDCTNANMAAYDVSQWKTSLTELLTQGKGAVCRGLLAADCTGCTPGPAGDTSFQVCVQWLEHDIPMRLTVEAQL